MENVNFKTLYYIVDKNPAKLNSRTLHGYTKVNFRSKYKSIILQIIPTKLMLP